MKMNNHQIANIIDNKTLINTLKIRIRLIIEDPIVIE